MEDAGMYDVRCTMYASLIVENSFYLRTVVHRTSDIVHYLLAIPDHIILEQPLLPEYPDEIRITEIGGL